MNPRGFFRGIKDFDVAMRDAIDERRVAKQGLATSTNFEQLGQLAEIPRRQVFVERRARAGAPGAPGAPGASGCVGRTRGPCDGSAGIAVGVQRRTGSQLLKMLLRLAAEFGSKLRQVATHR